MNYPVTDPRFVYVPSSHSDIRKTFAKLGFVPPSEAKLTGQPLTEAAEGKAEKVDENE